MQSEEHVRLAAGASRRYCPLEHGETVEADECEHCPFRPAPPYTICAPPRWALPRRRGFWDREVETE